MTTTSKIDLRTEALLLVITLAGDKINLSDEMMAAATTKDVKTLDNMRDDRIHAAMVMKDLVELIDKYDDKYATMLEILGKLGVKSDNIH